MSTAVMSSSTLYDFGDILYKNHTANNANNSNTNNNNNNRPSGGTTTNINMSSLHQKVLRWGADTAQRAVGGPVPLGRRSSNPGAGTASSTTIAVTASLVSSVSTLILDNIRSENAATTHHRKLDRSQSEPAPITPSSPSSAIIKAANINTSRYKTELCRPFEENGSCKYGDKCQFAHGAHELRNLVRHPKYKTELCRTFHTIGFCPYGPRCHFIHNAEEARTKPKPLELTGGSTAESPTSSLSQSPTNSVGSFFSEADVFTSMSPHHTSSVNTAFAFAQDFNTLVPVMGKQPSPGSVSPSPTASVDSLSPRGTPPPAVPIEARLPVFNRLSSSLALGGLEDLFA